MPTLAEVQSRQRLNQLGQSRVLADNQESLHPLDGGETWVTSNDGTSLTLADWVATFAALPAIRAMTEAEYNAALPPTTGTVYFVNDVLNLTLTGEDGTSLQAEDDSILEH